MAFKNRRNEVILEPDMTIPVFDPNFWRSNPLAESLRLKGLQRLLRRTDPIILLALLSFSLLGATLYVS